MGKIRKDDTELGIYVRRRFVSRAKLPGGVAVKFPDGRVFTAITRVAQGTELESYVEKILKKALPDAEYVDSKVLKHALDSQLWDNAQSSVIVEVQVVLAEHRVAFYE